MYFLDSDMRRIFSCHYHFLLTNATTFDTIDDNVYCGFLDNDTTLYRKLVDNYEFH